MNSGKPYKVDQSPFYKLNSKAVLASHLNLKTKSNMLTLLRKGDSNFYVSTLACGRQIEVPLPKLSRVHRRINRLISRMETPNYLNSGVKKRSNVKNARDHLGEHALLKIDIKNFYQSITEEQVSRCFVKYFRCSTDVSESIAKLCCFNGYLPTGSSISQSLAYLVNRPIFDHINTYSKSKGIKFTCYVDDLTFSGKLIPRGFIGYIRSYIKNSRGYCCHKIRMHKAITDKCVTGVVIRGNVLKVPNSQRKKIHSLRHLLENMTKNYHPSDEKISVLFHQLQGHLFCAGQVNPRYKQEGRAIVEHRKLLGIAAQNQKKSNKKNP